MKLKLQWPRSRHWRWLIKLSPVCILLVLGLWGLAEWYHGRTVEHRLDDLDGLIRAHAERVDLPADLVRRVVEAESGGDPDAVSPKKAYGLMQVTRVAERDIVGDTAAPGDLKDPDYNLRIGTLYLRKMVDRFKGDLWLALAAYNAGPTRIARLQRRHRGLSSRDLILRHAPKETRAYCRKILSEGPDRIPMS